MFPTKSLAAILMGAALVSVPASSQELNRSEVSVQAFGSFVKTTSDNGVQQSATDSTDAAGTSSSKTNSAGDAPAQAPAQVNEIKNGADPSAGAAPTSSSNDDSASSTSKKKKKKGLKKIVPF